MNRIFAITAASDRVPTGGDGRGEITLKMSLLVVVGFGGRTSLSLAGVRASGNRWGVSGAPITSVKTPLSPARM
jgi:hypothetical protein